MAQIGKILGQSRPAQTTNTTLYTVPLIMTDVALNLYVCNQSSSGSDNMRIALVPNGYNLDVSRYIVYDSAVRQNGFVQISGLALGPGDSVIVRSEHGNLSFTASGIESGGI